jgi:hypothetical protein
MDCSKNEGGMGFMDVVIFNQALLAKQCWRLFQNPTSLIARIYKAKYYPQSSIMEASLGTRPSFAWRSIYSSRTLSQNGIIWRVGDGHSIRFWGDRWLPTPITFKVQSPQHYLGENALVANLIDLVTKRWNTELFSTVFQEAEAHVIANIPLSPLQPPDCMIWMGATNNLFSICSAYHLGKKIEAHNK